MRALYGFLKVSNSSGAGYVQHGVLLSFFFCMMVSIPLSVVHAQDTALVEEVVISPVTVEPLVRPLAVKEVAALEVVAQVNEEPPLAEEDVFFQVDGADDGATLYFDSEKVLPTSEFVRPVDPVDVNPVAEPGSRFIIVDIDHKANSEEALLVSAQRAAKLGRYDAAQEMYKKLYAKNNRDPRILMGRAIVMQYLGQFEAAMQAYDEFLDVEPDNVEARINMLGLLGTKYPAVAVQRLDALRNENPAHAGIVAQLAINYGQLGRFTDALVYLEMASSIEPRNAGHMFNMAVMADRLGEGKRAVEYYEQSLEVDSIYGRSQSVPRDAIYKRLSELR